MNKEMKEKNCRAQITIYYDSKPNSQFSCLLTSRVTLYYLIFHSQQLSLVKYCRVHWILTIRKHMGRENVMDEDISLL